MSANQSSEMEEFSNSATAMRLQQEKEPSTMLLNKKFIIDPEVFHPGPYLTVVEFYNREVLKIVEEEIEKHSANATFDFLEVGCGAGYTSILVALSSEKCRVWATDINKAAIANAEKNAKLHGVEHRVKPLVADVFSNQEITGRKFDMIYWNHPWGGQQFDKNTKIDPLMYSIIDPGYSGLLRFLSDASGFMKATGRVMIAFSYSVGSEERLKSIANETGWKVETCATKVVMYELNGVTYNDVHVIVVEFVKKQA